MNEFEEDGPMLSDIATALAIILVVLVIAYAWTC